jgi:glycolate oxidase iron-sulfur subunit
MATSKTATSHAPVKIGSGKIGSQDAPRQADLDKCVHCGLCLNACPTYRELHIEMDSPRGRIFQMKQVAAGAAITEPYIRHLDLCLACRGCESACPSGVAYGRLIEAARTEIEPYRKRSWTARTIRNFVFKTLLPSRSWLQFAGNLLRAQQALGVKAPAFFPRLRELESLAPKAEAPFFFEQIGRVFPAAGERRYRVAFMAGCIANVAFARLNEATVRVLRINGCEVTIPGKQTCCGALHVHSGLRDDARALAKRNIDACFGVDKTKNFDAILTNAAGCGSTLKEYHELLEHDPSYAGRAREFSSHMKDVTEFLAEIGIRPPAGEVRETVTYQDSCHLAHGQGVRSAPRELLRQVTGLTFREMPLADVCCGSAGIYNVVETEMSMQVLASKMNSVNASNAGRIATANPGCMLQLQAGVKRFGRGQRVSHVIEILDEAYRNAGASKGPEAARPGRSGRG